MNKDFIFESSHRKKTTVTLLAGCFLAIPVCSNAWECMIRGVKSECTFYVAPPYVPPAKAYNFDQSRGGCVDVLGKSGLNPVSVMQKLGANDNWDCFDFSGQDFQQGDLRNKTLGNLSRSVKGSRFNQANMPGMIIGSQAISNANFSGANLSGANIGISKDADNMDFRGADLSGARIHGEQQPVCSKNWDFSGAKTDGLRIENLNLCDVALSGQWAAERISGSHFTRVKVGAGLFMARTALNRVQLEDLSGDQLELGDARDSSCCAKNVDLGPARLSALKINQGASKLAIRQAVIRQMDLTGGSVESLTITDSQIGNFVSTAQIGRAQFASSSLANFEAPGLFASFEQVKIIRGLFTGFRDLSFTKQSSCTNCAFNEANNAQLRFANSQFPSALFHNVDARVEIRQTDLSGSQWTQVAFTRDSSFDGAQLDRSTFNQTPLRHVMVRSHAVDCTMDNQAVFEIVEGSGSLDFSRCKIPHGVQLNADLIRDLKFNGAQIGGDFYNANRNTPELRNLDLSDVTATLSGNTLTCRDCKFDRANLKGSFNGLSLLNASAGNVKLDQLLSIPDKVEVSNSNFSQAQISGPIRGTYTKVNFQGATVGDLDRARFSKLTFTDGVIKGAIKSSEFSDCDFSMARFIGGAGSYIEGSNFSNCKFLRTVFAADSGGGESLSRVQKTSFVKSEFSGAQFGWSVAPWFSDVTFESCKFKGAFGEGEIKQLLRSVAHSAAKISVTNADWSGVDLTGVVMQSSELINVDLRRANLQRAKLQIMKIDGTRFDGADLSGARIEGDISNTRFGGANVNGAWIRGNLVGVDLSKLQNGAALFDLSANLDDVDFSNSDVHEAIVDDLHNTYKNLVLEGATISCGMSERIARNGTRIDGAYQAKPSRSEYTHGNQRENAGRPQVCERAESGPVN